MSTSLPKFNHPDFGGSYSNQFGQFESILYDAQKKGIINTPSNSGLEIQNYSSQKIRIQTIASRLWLLGYFKVKINEKNILKKISKIIKVVSKFQREANLEGEYWLGDKTWYALHELVSFESDITQSTWFNGQTIKPEVKNAFHRAVKLRLWSLGLFGYSPSKSKRLLKSEDLADFAKILKIFLIVHNPFKIDLNYDLLTILFDQDLLSSAVVTRKSKSNKSFSLKLGKEKFLNEKLAKRFIVNCAKVELWLLGYKVPINGKNDFTPSKNSFLYKALTKYYNDFVGLPIKDSLKQATNIKPTFFEGIINASAINISQKSDTISDEIAQTLTTEKINEAWLTLQKRGLRIWDGLKRIGRWILKIGRKVIEFIKINIFKAFFQYVSKAYKIIKVGVAAIVNSIKNYFKGGIISQNTFVGFSKDMDSMTFISSGTKKIESINIMDKMERQTTAFKLGCQIVGFVFDIIKNVMIGFVGWAKFLISLLRSYKVIKEFYLDFKTLAVKIN